MNRDDFDDDGGVWHPVNLPVFRLCVAAVAVAFGIAVLVVTFRGVLGHG